MELIVLTRGRRVQRALHLGRIVQGLLGVTACAMVAGSFWLGARYAAEGSSPDPRPDLYAAAMRQQMDASAERLDEAVAGARHDLDALTLRLSDLQARTIRLDALGGRLVALAGLDPEEFSFGEPPPRGGAAPSGEVAPNAVPDFIETLNGLERILELRAQELAALEASIMTGRLAEQVTPKGAPVLGGWVSSLFGRRTDPLTGAASFHYGVDFAGRRGSAIHAVAAGIVVFAGVRSGLGRVVEIDHGSGYMTRYAHNLENLVTAGQRVAKGEKVAKMGSSGRSTGNHVHFEVLQGGKPLDPMSYIRNAQSGS